MVAPLQAHSYHAPRHPLPAAALGRATVMRLGFLAVFGYWNFRLESNLEVYGTERWLRRAQFDMNMTQFRRDVHQGIQ